MPLHLTVDVLTAYLICGVSALVGAVMLRAVGRQEPRLGPALIMCSRAMAVFGAGLLPAAFGPGAAHPAAQFAMGTGTLIGLLLLTRGLGGLQGRDPGSRWAWAGASIVITANIATLQHDRLAFGLGFALGLAVCCTALTWAGRGFIVRPRDKLERGLAAALVAAAVLGWLRVAASWGYTGPPRVDMMYVPSALVPVLAAFYGVVPIVIATLLLGMVSARLTDQLRSRALTDELTGMLSRRALREVAEAMIEREQRQGREVAVLMLDLDHFKAINDDHGHAIGDRVLRRSAELLQAQLRPDALLARYGGEEFVALVPVDDLPTARRVSERLRAAIEHAAWSDAVPAGQRPPGVTTSVGVALLGPREPLDEALRRADSALYRAKREGRNQVQVGLRVA